MSEEKQVEGTLEEQLLASNLAASNEATNESPTAEASMEEVKSTEAPVEERHKLTPDQRMDVLQEIAVLSSAVNLVQYVPHFDNGNGGKQKPKLTKSTTLNLLDWEQLQQVKSRIIELINLL